MNNFDNCEIAIANVIVILLARIFYEVKSYSLQNSLNITQCCFNSCFKNDISFFILLLCKFTEMFDDDCL